MVVPRAARSFRGGPLLVVSALLFAVMALAAKEASRAMSGTQVAFVRSLMGLAACAGYHVFVRRLVARNRLGLLVRGATGALAVYAYFLAIEHLPVGIATLLNYTSPIFTAFWSVLLFRQRIHARAYAALLLTTVGLAAVIRGQAPAGAFGLGIWELTGLTASLFSGLSMVFIAELRKTDGAWEIFATFSLACALVSAPQALAHWTWPAGAAWRPLAVMGVASVAAQVGMTYAMREGSATVAGIVNQLTPVASLTFGWLLFDERFGRLTAAGIVFTLAGGSIGATLAAWRDPRRG